jgi:hypothetical protein
MKRCPQCEFIYEDDQSLCDMDGALLVFDARTLPNLRALAPIEAPLAPRAVWRHRTFPAMAALILATVLSLVYFVSTQRSTHSPARITGASISAPVANPALPAKSNQAVPAESNPAPPPSTFEVSGAAAPAKEENNPASTKAPATAPAAKKPAAVKTPTTERKPAEEPKKEESKVGSILKKTGRILKKPFKF